MADYDVTVVALVPVKRIVRVKAKSDSDARKKAVAKVEKEIEDGQDGIWSVPQESRENAADDNQLLGPSLPIHFEAIQKDSLITGMNPVKIVADEEE